MAKTLTLRLSDDQEQVIDQLMAHLNQRTASKALLDAAALVLRQHQDIQQLKTELQHANHLAFERYQVLERLEAAMTNGIELLEEVGWVTKKGPFAAVGDQGRPPARPRKR